jgi:hypothetical protein
MGFMEGTPPPVDPATFRERPHRERLRITAEHWAQHGFGGPKVLVVIYLVKLLVFFTIGGILIATLTSGYSPFDPVEWWKEPIIWQKFILWTVLLESLGMAGSWGPLAGHFKPMTAGFRHYGRVGTLRNPPYHKRLKWTKGDGFRTPFDVGLYWLIIVGILVALAWPGTQQSDVTEAIGPNEGMVPMWLYLPIIGGMILLGLRDKIYFLAARSEQYLPALVFAAFFPFVDMIVAAKLLIVCVWFGAGFSKLNYHFEHVIAPMMCNAPWVPKWAKPAMFKNYPEDLRPSTMTKVVAHGPGAFGELIPPLILLFSQNHTLSVAVAIFMVVYHGYIISTFPLAVPLEWNVVFMFLTAFLFIGYPNDAGYGLGDMDPVLLAITLPCLVIFPIIGNLRPDKVSFLPSMRQYAGNWASAQWAFAPGAEEKLDQHIKKASKMQKGQLLDEYGDEGVAEFVLHQLIGWRSMHSQGRGLLSLMMKHLNGDLDDYYIREAEFSSNALTGFNFGDAHMHDEYLINAIQSKCNFAPGEWIIAWVESEAVYSGIQRYWVMDAAVGIVERGFWKVKDAVNAHTDLRDGPIPLHEEWRDPSYVRPTLAQQGAVAPSAPTVAAGGAEPVPA